jgi:hypothetical protein
MPGTCARPDSTVWTRVLEVHGCPPLNNCHSPAVALDPLEHKHVLPVHVEVVPPSRERHVLTSRSDTDLHAPVEESIQPAAPIVEYPNQGASYAQTSIFQNVVVGGVD